MIITKKIRQTSKRAEIPGGLFTGIGGTVELEGRGGGSSRSPDPSPAPDPMIGLLEPAAGLIFIACIRAASPGETREEFLIFIPVVAPPADESALKTFPP